MQSQPELVRGLSNPRVSAAVADIQRDPQAALHKYAHDEEVGRFITSAAYTPDCTHTHNTTLPPSSHSLTAD